MKLEFHSRLYYCPERWERLRPTGHRSPTSSSFLPMTWALTASVATAPINTRLRTLSAGSFRPPLSDKLCGALMRAVALLLMTGRYAFHTGGLTNQSWRAGGPGAKSVDEYPIAKLLKQAGYFTGQAGKWRQVGEEPSNWGFDEYLTDNTASGWYWETKYNKNGRVLNLPEGTYGPDLIQDFTFDFLKRHKDKPFFFYYAMHLVHKPTVHTPDSMQGTRTSISSTTIISGIWTSRLGRW